jgi:hypothetical protein
MTKPGLMAGRAALRISLTGPKAMAAAAVRGALLTTIATTIVKGAGPTRKKMVTAMAMAMIVSSAARAAPTRRARTKAFQPDPDGKKGRRGSRADDGEGDGEGDDRQSRRSRRADEGDEEDDEDAQDEEDEREMRGRSPKADARRRERSRCCAIVEAACQLMGNPAALEEAISQMSSPTGRHRAIRTVERVARASGRARGSRDEDRDDREDRARPPRPRRSQPACGQRRTAR